MYSKLQYISSGTTTEEQFVNIQATLQAGCRWVQLRFKNGSHGSFLKLAEKVRKACHEYNATFIVNDNVDIAKAVDADGVHLGLKDMPVMRARQILGEKKIIGGSANTLEDVRARIEENCDYIGLGPYRYTPTKEKLSPILGLEGIKKVVDKISSSVSVYAIGGIFADDVSPLLKAGVYGVAVSGCITNYSDKKKIIRTLNKFLDGKTSHSR